MCLWLITKLSYFHRSTNFVNKDGIVITTTTNTAAGLRIILYAVLINGGVLSKDALGTAIQVDWIQNTGYDVGYKDTVIIVLFYWAWIIYSISENVFCCKIRDRTHCVYECWWVAIHHSNHAILLVNYTVCHSLRQAYLYRISSDRSPSSSSYRGPRQKNWSNLDL